jgi:hypothetical protein
MTSTQFLHRCPIFEDLRDKVWKAPMMSFFTRPRSIVSQLGNPLWEKSLLIFLEKTTIEMLGYDNIHEQIRRVERDEQWYNTV